MMKTTDRPIGKVQAQDLQRDVAMDLRKIQSSCQEAADSIADHAAQLLTIISDIENIVGRLDAIEEYGCLFARDEKAAGTAGGDATSGAWRVRELNTEMVNTITGASLNSNIITLPAGRYRVFCRAPARAIGNHKARLYNVTDGEIILVGSTAFTSSAAITYATTDSIVMGEFTITASKDVRLEHRVAVSRNGDGWGNATNFGVVEVYSEVQVVKIS